MERDLKNFKGQIIEDYKGNIYFVNGLVENSTTSEEMVVYTSLDTKREVFTTSQKNFLGLSPSSQSYRFFLTNKNIAIPKDMIILEDKQFLENIGSSTFPKPHKTTVILIIILIFCAFIGTGIVAFTTN
ncbi:DUF1653 domain-containing protein [uncultured Clostridium sp.]|uniref:DUF1653 domain-containing protein n=1 Tax=uncultured Clostridium sp. TaxID=59620 RepID=UPI002607143C|nr:DUF1653 domain-containing protein [uncultured Clostridium sp.]